MAAAGEDLQENLETYEAQLKQVEAALMIDDDNEELKKLRVDLTEVITLTKELLEINETPAEADVVEEKSVAEKPKEWKVGDRCQALKVDKKYYNATIDMISDDRSSCGIKFDNSGSLVVVKVESLLPVERVSQPSSSSEKTAPKQKLTKEEIERRKENKKKKLAKKKQRMKDFEEAREAGKQRWQTFYKKGSQKGKHKMRGLNKKSIFASSDDGKGKIGIGTCGTSGRGMTQFASPSQYMYKK